MLKGEGVFLTSSCAAVHKSRGDQHGLPGSWSSHSGGMGLLSDSCFLFSLCVCDFLQQPNHSSSWPSWDVRQPQNILLLAAVCQHWRGASTGQTICLLSVSCRSSLPCSRDFCLLCYSSSAFLKIKTLHAESFSPVPGPHF